MKIKVNARVAFFGFVIDFFTQEDTQSGNSQGLIRLSNNSISRAMCKERKQIMSMSLDSRFFRENVLAWMKITKGNFVTFLMLVGLRFN